MEKKSKKIKLCIVILAICLLSIEGFAIYKSTNNRLNELQQNLDDLSNIIFSIHNKNVDIMYRLNMNLSGNTEDVTITYDDELYTCYEVESNVEYTNGKAYLVYDKQQSAYIKDGVPDSSAITHFVKIADSYYYFVLSVDNDLQPKTDIYKIGSGLVTSFDAIYKDYDESTNTFSFIEANGVGQNNTYTWSPTE